MAKKATRGPERVAKERKSNKTAAEPPESVDAEQGHSGRLNPRVSHAFGETVEVTVCGDDCREALSKLIGCEVPLCVSAISVTAPRENVPSVVTFRFSVPVDAQAFAASHEGS